MKIEYGKVLTEDIKLNLDGYEKVYLKDMDLMDIFEIDTKGFDFNYIPFKKFIIFIDKIKSSGKYEIKVDKSDKFIHLKQYNDGALEWTGDIDINTLRLHKFVAMPIFLESGTQAKLQHNAGIVIRIAMNAIFFVCTKLEEVKKVEYKDVNSSSKKKSAKISAGPSKIIISGVRVVYVNRNKNNEHRHYNIHTNEYSRRGHWRHYKTGKKIWIENNIITREAGDKKAQIKEYIIKK
ncbi:MAG: hypothetical protein ACRCX8_19640 [Sarcina sp.]